MVTENTSISVVDPGFPNGSANSRGGALTYYFAQFLPKTTLKGNYLDPPMYLHFKSKSVSSWKFTNFKFSFFRKPGNSRNIYGHYWWIDKCNCVKMKILRKTKQITTWSTRSIKFSLNFLSVFMPQPIYDIDDILIAVIRCLPLESFIWLIKCESLFGCGRSTQNSPSGVLRIYSLSTLKWFKRREDRLFLFSYKGSILTVEPCGYDYRWSQLKENNLRLNHVLIAMSVIQGESYCD